ncbi:uncharacterized protein LOC106132182 [Amyelois transitella]|uniref:uncharacterized protein LOC106132182 n=1 Tax=Amyelois transitella TaxID=680683 RepID=UPI00067CBB6C|nr:uncharacterized protein LOC106132182 [Amyelois transitella]
MDSCSQEHNECIRKIEDIIDMEKAKGSFNSRQVAFNLPSESGSTVSTNLVKSLESGLAENKIEHITKKSFKKLRTKKRHKSPLPDVISWPSDSDITVLRMKLCLTSDLKENVINTIPGDGFHQPDSSSMVNLATLILQSRHPSKHSIEIEEYLLPLSSWERDQNKDAAKDPLVEIRPNPEDVLKPIKKEDDIINATCSHELDDNDDSSTPATDSRKSKLAKFLRLYFCPCCTCLYKMEAMREPSSVCFTKRKEAH